ncbi:MAG TPA: hypothetical protein VLC48_09705 [Gemmatimonadota bacterium]|nr:hypothetical protein [Gemmatimonadota bacterium]
MSSAGSLRLRLLSMVIISAVLASCGPREPDFPRLTGDYLGQTPPGEVPELFAPGIVSTGMYVRDIAMTPDGGELYYGVALGNFTVIMQAKRVGGVWTKPEVAPFAANPEHFSFEPHISPDGQRFFFLSNRPRDGGTMPDDQRGQWVNEDIWVMDRAQDGWSEPYNLGPPVNTDSSEFFPSVTNDGTLYFTRSFPDGRSFIYRARPTAAGFAPPQRLPVQVNSTNAQYNAFIAPDESYLIVPVFGREDSYGRTDYYIVFRNMNDEWSEPVNMGDRVNTPRNGEYSPFVSRDGKYFFFMSTRGSSWEGVPDALTHEYLWSVFSAPQNGNSDIYWVQAAFIEQLRSTARWGPE